MVPPTDRALRLRTPKPSDQEKIMKLSNKIVLVTGGTSGIGLEAAKLFREEGATVIIVGHDPARLQAAASQLGDSITVLRGDVKKPAELENVVNQIREKFGRIDVLFANAGMGLASPLEAVTKIKSTRNSM
jgi:NAD(P)-dependent dehydrogenase (short-subunit alcohol dehydrogenase family)